MATKHVEQDNFFELYNFIRDYIQDKYFSRKPIICETLFFPSAESEKKMINMIRTSMKTLDICVFTITNDRIAEAILECFKRGVAVRIITDDQKTHEIGSDIYRLWNAVFYFIIIILSLFYFESCLSINNNLLGY